MSLKDFSVEVPYGVVQTNKNKILKHIKDFYRAKGNEASFQYIFRLLYGKEDVQFYYPSNEPPTWLFIQRLLRKL